MIKISFLGDVALNGDYISFVKNGINPFSKIEGFLSSSDFVIANLEAVSEGDLGENKLKSPRLKVNRETLFLLKYLNIDLVTLANNHIYDNLLDGYNKTIEFLNKNNIEHIGAYPLKSTISKYLIKRINDKRIAFLNYVHPDTNPSLPVDAQIEINLYNKNEILNQIRMLKRQVDYIFLILHWGMDNSAFPAPWQRKDANEFIEAGTDFLIGHHSHTLQGFELIKDKPVFYSLGNFCFAPFEAHGSVYEPDQNRHSRSVILNIIIDNNKFEKEFIPIISEDLYVNIGTAKTINKINRLSYLIPLFEIIWPIYKIYLNFFYKLYFYLFGNNRDPIERFKKIDKRRIKRFFKLFGFK